MAGIRVSNNCSKPYDFHASAYDSVAGRFTSTDPVAGVATIPQTLNPYGLNGPVVYTDPYGYTP